MKKIFFQRGPDGLFHEFHETGPRDEWLPLPGQDVQIVSALTGNGWYLVVSVRQRYSGSIAHDQLARELDHKPTMVYDAGMEVYLEAKRLKACEVCGVSALNAATFCFHCGTLLPADGGVPMQAPVVPPRPRAKRIDL